MLMKIIDQIVTERHQWTALLYAHASKEMENFPAQHEDFPVYNFYLVVRFPCITLCVLL